MPGVDVEVGAKTGGFASGMARIRAELAKLKAQANAGFSIGGAIKGLATFFGARAVLDGVVGVFQRISELAGRAQERAQALLTATQALASVRYGPENRLSMGTKDEAFLKKQSADARKRADEANNDWKTFIPGAYGDYFRQIADHQEQIAQNFEAAFQARAVQNRELAFQIENENRMLDRQIAKEVDLADVRAGRLSLEQAARREQERADKEFLRVAQTRALGPMALKKADIEAKQATFALQDAAIQTIAGFKADSLARIGGGGNVYTGGVAADPVTSELRVQTQVLREIAMSVAGDKSGLRHSFTTFRK